MLIVSLCITSAAPAYAQSVMNLPAPGSMVLPSQPAMPIALQGLKVDSTNPFHFDFVVDSGSRHSELVIDPRLRGDDTISSQELEAESQKLVNYFLAALTTPEEDLWVNLSPYEADRIVPDALGQTTMGRDMLVQDYILKQLTASLMHPEGEVGKKFWNEIYRQAFERYGITDIPVDTFHKVWIVPEEAEVFEHDMGVLITKSTLDVKLERDYVAAQQTNDKRPMTNGESMVNGQSSVVTSDDLSSEVMRKVIIPAIKKEVNEGEHFAPLRQIYQAIILAKWYKTKLKAGIVNHIYSDQNKTHGIEHADDEVIKQIYDQYVAAFKQGVFDLIKDEVTNDKGQMTNAPPLVSSHLSSVIEGGVVPRRYFSGGTNFAIPGLAMTTSWPKQFNGRQPYHVEAEIIPNDSAMILNVDGIDTTKVPDKKGNSRTGHSTIKRKKKIRRQDRNAAWQNLIRAAEDETELDQVSRDFNQIKDETSVVRSGHWSKQVGLVAFSFTLSNGERYAISSEVVRNRLFLVFTGEKKGASIRFEYMGQEFLSDEQKENKAWDRVLQVKNTTAEAEKKKIEREFNAYKFQASDEGIGLKAWKKTIEKRIYYFFGLKEGVSYTVRAQFENDMLVLEFLDNDSNDKERFQYDAEHDRFIKIIPDQGPEFKDIVRHIRLLLDQKPASVKSRRRFPVTEKPIITRQREEVVDQIAQSLTMMRRDEKPLFATSGKTRIIAKREDLSHKLDVLEGLFDLRNTTLPDNPLVLTSRDILTIMESSWYESWEELSSFIGELMEEGFVQSEELRRIVASSRPIDEKRRIINHLRLYQQSSSFISNVISSTQSEKDILGPFDYLQEKEKKVAARIAYWQGSDIFQPRDIVEMENLGVTDEQMEYLASQNIFGPNVIRAVLRSENACRLLFQSGQSDAIGVLKSEGLYERRAIRSILTTSLSFGQIIRAIRRFMSITYKQGKGVSQAAIARIIVHAKNDDDMRRQLSYLDNVTTLSGWWVHALSQPNQIKELLDNMFFAEGKLPPLDQELTQSQKANVRFRLKLRELPLENIHALIDDFFPSSQASLMKRYMAQQIEKDQKKLSDVKADIARSHVTRDTWWSKSIQHRLGLLLFSFDESIRQEVIVILYQKHIGLVNFFFREKGLVDVARDHVLGIVERYNVFVLAIKDDVDETKPLSIMFSSFLFKSLLLFRKRKAMRAQSNGDRKVISMNGDLRDPDSFALENRIQTTDSDWENFGEGLDTAAGLRQDGLIREGEGLPTITSSDQGEFELLGFTFIGLDQNMTYETDQSGGQGEVKFVLVGGGQEYVYDVNRAIDGVLAPVEVRKKEPVDKAMTTENEGDKEIKTTFQATMNTPVIHGRVISFLGYILKQGVFLELDNKVSLKARFRNTQGKLVSGDSFEQLTFTKLSMGLNGYQEGFIFEGLFESRGFSASLHDYLWGYLKTKIEELEEGHSEEFGYISTYTSYMKSIDSRVAFYQGLIDKFRDELVRLGVSDEYLQREAIYPTNIVEGNRDRVMSWFFQALENKRGSGFDDAKEDFLHNGPDAAHDRYLTEEEKQIVLDALPPGHLDDEAMVVGSEGGIAFRDVDVVSRGRGSSFEIDPAQLVQMKKGLLGFEPKIVGIRRIDNLARFMGVAQPILQEDLPENISPVPAIKEEPEELIASAA